MERRSRWSFEYATAIFHFSFYISHFSFPILDSCGSAPSGRYHRPRDWGIAGKAVSEPIVERRLPGPHHTTLHIRVVGLSNCRTIYAPSHFSFITQSPCYALIGAARAFSVPPDEQPRKETAKRSDKPAAGERSVTDRQSAHVRPAASGSRNNCAESSDSATKRPPPISRSALDAREEKTMLLRSGQQNNFVVDASSSEAPP